MKNTIKILLLSLLFMQIAFSQGWETLYTLPDAVKGATSTASDGYGVHLVGVYNNVVKHFWVGNDNTVVWSTFSVTGGLMPQVSSYDGIVRITMKVIVNNEQKLRIYQSEDGGYAWTQLLSDYTPAGQPSIYNLYAFSDGYGTHITWDDNPNSGTNNFENEVYYVRVNQTPEFVNFRNVTDLSSPSKGGRPRVAVSGNKACVTFLNATNFGRLTSRDLNLDNNTWDSFYRFGPENTPQLTLSSASIGNILYTVGKGDVIVGWPCNQELVSHFRNINDASWSVGTLGGCTAGGNMRNALIKSEGILRMINYNPETGVEAFTFDPSSGIGLVKL